MRRILFTLILIIDVCSAQTNSIDIGSTQQTISPGTTFNPWTVTAMSNEMLNALCYENTTGSQGPTPGKVSVPPVNIGQAALIKVTSPYTYLSCFPYNTIYTVKPPSQPTSGNFDYSMNIRRQFYICSNNPSESITFNFNAICDDAVDSIVIDATSANPIRLLTVMTKTVGTGSPLNLNKTVSLTPGLHTIDILCADWQDPIGGVYYPITVNGQQAQYQWNPFGVAIIGTISSSNYVLLNSNPPVTVAGITGDTSTCVGSSTALSNTTTGGSWSSSNTNVATISQTGVLTGVSQGSVIITYAVGQGACANSVKLNVNITNCNLTCNNWLNTIAAPSSITIGNLGVAGNQLTVEAEFNSTLPTQTTGYDAALVSKHSSPSDCNFVLRTDVAQLATSNGLVTLFSPCAFQPKKTYHVAMVYDGKTLKYYRDGFLLASAACSGNLVVNSLPTTIAEKAGGSGSEQLYGYINEVRIWNVARTQAQLQANMNSSLPTPTTQTGLLGYYTFGNLTNRQGNATFNGTIKGNAMVNATNPNCAFVADSCCAATATTIDTAICQGQTFLGHAVTGTYIDTLTNVTGCDSIVTTHLTILPINVSAGNDTSVCKKTTFLLHGSGTNISTFAWTPKMFLNDSTLQSPSAVIDSTVTFYVTAKNTAGCSAQDSVKINTYLSPIFTVSTNQTTCTTTPVQLNASGGDSYLWTPSQLVSNPNIPNPLTNSDTTTTYSVLIKESTCNNSSTLITTVTIVPTIKLTATKSNDLDCTTGSSQLFVSGADSYIWSPGKDLNDSTIANPIASPSTTQQYIVKGINNADCVGQDTIVVYANLNNNKANYYMANAFTPNGDGTNDCYGIKYWGQIQQINFSIYNRWGKRVFYTTNADNCWDGMYNGQPAVAGTYVYHIIATTACGPVEVKGSLILIR